jgi:transposase
MRVRLISEQEVAELERLSKKIKGCREYCRLQSVLLRARDGKTAKEIAILLNLNKRTVEKHHERYFKEGFSAFVAKKPGKSGPRLFTREAEKALLENLESKSCQGEIIAAFQIKEAAEQQLGKKIALGTVYLLLHRNDWRKVKPRPRHPKGNDAEKEVFKKTC